MQFGSSNFITMLDQNCGNCANSKALTLNSFCNLNLEGIANLNNRTNVANTSTTQSFVVGTRYMGYWNGSGTWSDDLGKSYICTTAYTGSMADAITNGSLTLLGQDDLRALAITAGLPNDSNRLFTFDSIDQNWLNIVASAYGSQTATTKTYANFALTLY